MVKRSNRVFGYLRQGLIRAHHVQIVIGADPENIEHLIEHLPVLGGSNSNNVEKTPLSPELENDRCQLDGIRPGTENHGNLLRSH
jgi:hypothetical protein